MYRIRTIMSYVFAALSGACFVGGMAILSGGKGQN